MYPFHTPMNRSRWLTAVVDESGNRIGVFDDEASAERWALTQSSEVFASRQYGGLSEIVPNPPLSPDRMPERAWARVGGMHVTRRELEDLGLEDAVRRLRQLKMADTGAEWLLGIPRDQRGRVWVMPRQYMVKVKDKNDKVVMGPDGEPVLRIEPLSLKSEAFVENFLASNAKMAKDHPVVPADLQGLSMLPANYIAMRGGCGRNSLHGAGPVSPAEVVGEIPKGVNLCVGSNTQCRTSCLVFSGQNEVARHNRRKKEALAVALFMDPVAFCRVLVEAIRKFTGTWSGEKGGGRRRLHPLTRLNVFSDVPWELVCPSLFDIVGNADFYDYTKVPSRPEMCADILSSYQGSRRRIDVAPFPPNYHLTFSASGDNDAYCYSEMVRGRKIAVVFETDKHRIPTWFDPSFWPEETFFPVVPGDVSDLRPFDASSVSMAKAIAKIGEPDADWDEERLKKYQARLVKTAHRIEFGARKRLDLSTTASTGPGIVGLFHKPPQKREPRRKQREEIAKRRLQIAEGVGGKRLFLVPVQVIGSMIMAEGCGKTVAYGKAVVPEDQPLVREISAGVREAMPAAARRSTKRRPPGKP